jgi:hypothetical protein
LREKEERKGEGVRGIMSCEFLRVKIGTQKMRINLEVF